MENFKYMPIFRARQQEMIVLNEFDFGNKIIPLIEIIKEKDRKNNHRSSFKIYSELVNSIKANNVFIDLPIYIQLSNSTNIEVVAFSRSIIENLQSRIDYLRLFKGISKVIPVISGLTQKTGELNTIITQFDELRNLFPVIGFRTFHNTIEQEEKEIIKCLRPNKDVLIYDIDNISITSPVFRMQRPIIGRIKAYKKILIRSSINNTIQNVNLEHTKVVAEADNSLIEMFSMYHFDVFGDYVGIKKDNLTSGGTISPGLIFYDPNYNLYYGYKGKMKSLDEFKNTIIPAVLNSSYIQTLSRNFPQYIDHNNGIEIMKSISNGNESGKSQAKFKKIAMMHYLHCMKTAIEGETQLPLS